MFQEGTEDTRTSVPIMEETRTYGTDTGATTFESKGTGNIVWIMAAWTTLRLLSSSIRAIQYTPTIN